MSKAHYGFCNVRFSAWKVTHDITQQEDCASRKSFFQQIRLKNRWLLTLFKVLHVKWTLCHRFGTMARCFVACYVILVSLQAIFVASASYRSQEFYDEVRQLLALQNNDAQYQVSDCLGLFIHKDINTFTLLNNVLLKSRKT